MLALALIVAALLVVRARKRFGVPPVQSRFGQGRKAMRAATRKGVR